MRGFIERDERWPEYFPSPSPDDANAYEIPDELIAEHRAALERFELVQAKLKVLWTLAEVGR